jgi:ABC-type glycerol-3-phosphate transport system substrate-binding protein
MKKMMALTVVLTVITGMLWAAGTTEQVKLSIALGSTEVHEGWYDLFEEENPDITVENFTVPGASFEDFLRARAAADNLPDLFVINPNPFSVNLTEDGFVADLSNTKAANNTYPGLLEPFTTPGGQVFGIPVGTATTWMYYNIDMFDDAGITEVPKDWDEFLSALEKLTNAGYSGTVIDADGFGNTWFSYIFGQNIVTHEPNFVEKIAQGTLDFTQSGVADIYGKIQSLIDKGYAHQSFMNTTNAEASSLFLQGKAATLFAGSWQAKQLLEGDIDAGIFFPPVKGRSEETMAVLAPESGAGISERSPRKEYAFQLLEWMFGDGYEFYQNGMGNVPSMMKVDGEIQLDQKVIDILAEIENYPQTRLWFQYMPADTLPLIFTLQQQVFLGELTPAEVAIELDRTAKDAVKE